MSAGCHHSETLQTIKESYSDQRSAAAALYDFNSSIINVEQLSGYTLSEPEKKQVSLLGICTFYLNGQESVFLLSGL